MATENVTKELFKKFWKQNKDLLAKIKDLLVKNKEIKKEDEKLLLQFWRQNKELLLKVVEILKDSNDKDISDEDKKVMQELLKKRRDDTKYVLNGNYKQPLQKNQLVLAVVKQYVKDDPNITFNKLSKKFPKQLQGGRLGVFEEISKIQDDTRYFCKDNEIITLNDDTKIAVCNQWGTPNIDCFVDHVTKKLNYTITEVE